MFARLWKTVRASPFGVLTLLQPFPFLKSNRWLCNPQNLALHSRNGEPLHETNVLTDGLRPSLRAVGLPKTGMHAFRRGCNRRWELAGVNPAIIRLHMGHSSAAMKARYTGEILLGQVRVVTNRDHRDQRRFEAVA
jgi:integrase